ncbi:MAG: type VI secretion system baseplate subunit TssE [Methylococcaceae bacterium]|jgi:type VI secretion system protein ImpF
MAELLHTERLQPSLLDRLTDNAPEQRQESREQRVLSSKQLKQSVLRDLSWLLNTTALEALEDLSNVPYAARSVLNYGVQALAGTHLSSAEIPKIEKKLKLAISDFEPRIFANSLKVVLVLAEGQMNQKALSFKIEGDLWAQPLPIHLYIRSDIDLETGAITVKDLDA